MALAEGGPETPSGWSVPPPAPVLGAGEIHLYSLDLDLPRSRLARLAPALSTAERERAARFHFDQDRNRYLAGRGQLRAILGRYLGRESADVRLEIGPFGKPALAAGSSAQPLRFNLSRSVDLGLVALRMDEDLGVDVEAVRPFGDALAIAARMFATAEFQALGSLPEPARLEGFFRYWTRKEAVVKSIGRGLGHALDRFVLSPRWVAESIEVEGETGPVGRWVTPLVAARPGFVAALATRSPSSVRCWTWSGEPA